LKPALHTARRRLQRIRPSPVHLKVAVYLVRGIEQPPTIDYEPDAGERAIFVPLARGVLKTVRDVWNNVAIITRILSVV